MPKRRLSLADVRYLYRARLRRKAVLAQEIVAVLGIAVGVALLFASQLAGTSLTRSVEDLTSQLVGHARGLQLDARGPDGFDERLLSEVQRLPSVQAATPVLEQQASVMGPSGRRSVDLIGADPRFVHASGPLLRRFSAKLFADQRAIALPVPLADDIGVRSLQPIKLQIGANVVETLLATTLEEADIGGLIHSPVVLAPVRYAQQLAGMQGRITRIFVQERPGHEREMRMELSRIAAAANVNIEPAGFDSTLLAVASGPQSQSERMFSAISALVGFMFALNAMLLTVPTRRKLIEDLRPIGATRRINIQIMLFDALILGVLACLLGLALGELLSVAVFHSTPGYLAFAFPVGNDRVITWQSVIIAVGAGMAAASAGVLWPLRRILLPRTLSWRPDSEPRQRNWFSVRLIAGLACLVLTTLILLLRPQAAIFGNFTLIVALLCLLPSLFGGVVNLFEHLQRPFNGASPRIAITNLRIEQTHVRSLAITATVAVAVFGMVSIQGAQANLERGLNASAHGVDSSADVWITVGGRSNPDATVPFKDPLGAETLSALPSVSRVGVYRGSFLNWGDRRIWVLAPPPRGFHTLIAPSQLISGNLALASTRLQEGGWVALGQALASEQHLHIGQTFMLPSPRPVRLRVAALITNLGWPPGAVVMSSADYASAWASNDTSAYLIRAKRGTTPTALRRVVQSALATRPGFTVETYAEREHLHETFIRQGLSRLTQIRLLVLIAAILSVAGALAAMTWQRRDLVAFIRCVGYHKGVLWRWLLCESALLLIAGCSIGAVFGLYGQILLSHALASVTGFPIVLQAGVLIALSNFALVSALAIVAVALAGYLVVRVRPKWARPPRPNDPRRADPQRRPGVARA